MIRVHAISEVDGGRRGIHVLFCGPPAWLYALDGWTVQRRLSQRRRGDMRCAVISGAALAELRRERELVTPIGMATLRDGTWLPPTGGAPDTAEVLAMDLTTPTTTVRVVMAGPNWTAYGLFRGKVVAAAPPHTQAGQEMLGAPAIDRVVIHAQHASSWQVCALVEADDSTGWQSIAELQLPVTEVDASLTTSEAEFERATERLIDGDELDRSEFGDIADGLRGLGSQPPTRPIDWSIRPDPASPDTVLGALDPLRLALLDPTLRRAIGMAHFDDDPSLVQGESYQYRVRAKFPADADSARAGFACIPVGTMVPADFFFGDIHIRLAMPSRVEFVPTHTAGDTVVGRRGIGFRGDDRRLWLLPDLQDAGIVMDFAVPRSAIIIEVVEADLQFEAYDDAGGGIGVSAATRPGETALTFAAPCARLVVRGKGRWLGLRDGLSPATEFTSDTQPVVFAPTPGPPPPLWLRAVSTNTAPVTGVRPRSELGFDVAWQPPFAMGAIAWPPDADAAPPLEVTRFELEHAPDGQPFSGVFGDKGAVFGQRSDATPAQLGPGGDAMVLFGEDPPPPTGAGGEFSIRDQFLREPPIPEPTPGTMHRYRVRSIDEIGRAGDWLVSSAARLEKHAPPPIPVGPPRGQDDDGPTGVQARVLVRGAPDLTAVDVALLDDAGADSAIVLRWGWTAEQRELDPWATAFRVYLTDGGIGSVPGDVTAVADLGAGRYEVALSLRRAVAADTARGSFLPAGGEYRILAHGPGATIQATVETRLPALDGTFRAPRIGPTVLPVPWSPAHSRPDAWDERVAVVPITDAVGYQLVLYDRLTPTADRPRVMTWVGVSAADAQPYVADTRAGGGLAGNESPIVGIRCEARYHGRPDLVASPPIGDVPVVVTARSSTAGVEHDIDLLPYLAGNPLAAGERVVIERLDDGALLSALRSDGSDIVGVPPDSAPPDADEMPITVPNPTDRAAIVAALAGPPEAMADRYLVWLAARHPHADWLFTPLPEASTLGTAVRFTLPAGGARFVSRVRRVDAAGHRSAGSATCAVVLRVPALAPLAPPVYGGSRWTMSASGPRLEFTASVSDARATHLLTWIAATDPRSAALSSIGSRRDLPGFGVRLRIRDGSALIPEVAALDTAPLEPATGARTLIASHDLGSGPHFVWLAAVDDDGVPSALAGGYRLAGKEA